MWPLYDDTDHHDVQVDTNKAFFQLSYSSSSREGGSVREGGGKAPHDDTDHHEMNVQVHINKALFSCQTCTIRRM